MTRQFISYIRGAGQILDMSGSYPLQVMNEIRSSMPAKTSAKFKLKKDLERVGMDLQKAVERAREISRER